MKLRLRIAVSVFFALVAVAFAVLWVRSYYSWDLVMLRKSWKDVYTMYRSFADAMAKEARYNIAPTQDVAVVRLAEGGRELVMMRWGLIPAWTKDPKKCPLLINARADTVAEKPSFRSAFKSRRCLIPADGYYEWKAAGRQKQPYLLEIHGGEPFAFAGLWERWQSIESCAIITTDANELAAQFHDRMPAILSQNDYDAWLDPTTPEPGKLLAPYPTSEMTATPVSTYVNNVRNEGSQCVEPPG